MTYLGDKPFRMPDSWYDPPEPPPTTVCPDCSGEGKVPCEECGQPTVCVKCGGSGEVEVSLDDMEDPDPDRAYEEMRDRRFEEG